MVSSLIKRLLGGRAHLDNDDIDEDWTALLDSTKDTLRAMERDAIRLDLEQRAPVPDEPTSCFGGRASLPPGADWPRDAANNPMLFLAQINYGDMPRLEGFPRSGLLSVFIAGDDVSGCDFPSRDQVGFMTDFHPDPTGFVRQAMPATETDLLHPYGQRLAAEGAPVRGHAQPCLPSASCYATQGLIAAWPGNAPAQVSDDLFDWLIDHRPGPIYYGGHPDFIQYDIRQSGDQPAFTEVLLQQGHFWTKDRDWEICWGDAGEATFLLPAEELAAHRFERAIYNWDCG